MREVVAGIIGIICGTTCYSMFKSLAISENIIIEIVSFIVFILTSAISWFALKYLDKLDEDKR